MSRIRSCLSGCIAIVSLALLICVLCLPSHADSVSLIFSGTASAGEAQQQLNVSGGSGNSFFSVSSTPPDGPGTLGNGTLGVPITFTWGAATNPTPDFTDGTFGSYNTSIVLGGLTFTGTFTVPASALTAGTFTTAMSVVGDFQAFQQINLPDGTFQQGPQLGTVHFQGQANVTFTITSMGGNQFVFQGASATFTGTGTETTLTPEPASLLLVGTGLSGLALKLKKRRKLIA